MKDIKWEDYPGWLWGPSGASRALVNEQGRGRSRRGGRGGGGRWKGSLEDAAVLAVKMGSEAVDQRHRQSLSPGKGSSLRGNQPSDAFPSAP